MRRFLQKTLGVALMGILLATPFMYGQGKKGGKGGGGRPDMAQAGGPDGSKAQAALEAIEAQLAG